VPSNAKRRAVLANIRAYNSLGMRSQNRKYLQAVSYTREDNGRDMSIKIAIIRNINVKVGSTFINNASVYICKHAKDAVTFIRFLKARNMTLPIARKDSF